MQSYGTRNRNPEEPQMQPTTESQSQRRLAGVVAGVAAMILALSVVALGAGGLWADSHRGHDGYVSTGSHRFDTAGRALTSPGVEIGKAAPGWLIRRVRISATGTASARPVFVGIGRSTDVASYLANVSRSELRDFDGGTPVYANQTGSRTPAPPATRHFWVATAEGRGTQTLRWKPKPGHWDVVVMNADGTPTVDAAVSLGAQTPPLLVPGLALVGFGVMIGIGGFALVYRSARPLAPIARPVPAAA
jgi:hypothetical protein